MAKQLKDAVERLAAATDALEEATKRFDLNELEKVGASARFCIAFEMSWKTLRLTLIDSFGRGSDVAASPKPILRLALQDGLITDIAVWFAFLESRNSFAHIYKQTTADIVFASAVRFPSVARALLAELRRHVNAS